MVKILNDLNTLLLPKLCFGCNAHLYRGESHICAFCRHELPITEYRFGLENAATLRFYGEKEVSHAMALLHYENGGLVQHLVHGLKYKGREGLGVTLGAWLGETLLRDPDTGNVDWVLPVPLHWRRRLRRGYNQCTGMAQAMAVKLGAQTSEHLLVRSRFSHTQTHRDRAGRWAGSRNTFRVRNPQRLEGCRILLVDDVITTGATLRACCQALKAVGNKEVLIAALAVVP